MSVQLEKYHRLYQVLENWFHDEPDSPSDDAEAEGIVAMIHERMEQLLLLIERKQPDLLHSDRLRPLSNRPSVPDDIEGLGVF